MQPERETIKTEKQRHITHTRNFKKVTSFLDAGTRKKGRSLIKSILEDFFRVRVFPAGKNDLKSFPRHLLIEMKIDVVCVVEKRMMGKLYVRIYNDDRLKEWFQFYG